MITITIPTWVVVVFGTLFLAQLLCSLCLIYLKSRLEKHIRETK